LTTAGAGAIEKVSFYIEMPLKEALKLPNIKKQEKEIKTEKRDYSSLDLTKSRVKFEIYGEEMIEKKVKSSGNSGRVYLPPSWVGRQVKIIRID